MNDIKIHIKFFGYFRKFGDGLDLSVPTESTIEKIKSIIQHKLDGEKLVLDSVLANSTDILQDDYILDQDIELSILPPVCGG